MAPGATPATTTPATTTTTPTPTQSATVTFASEYGTVTAAVVVDEHVRDGVVSFSHGRLDANPGRLTSGDVDVDPLTAMPRVAGLAVTISPTRQAD
jgi:hypothetical protein